MIDAAALPSFASGVVVKFKRDEFIVTFFDILGLVQKSEGRHSYSFLHYSLDVNYLIYFILSMGRNGNGNLNVECL